MSDYKEFIAGKKRKLKPMGFDVDADRLNPFLKDWQRRVVAFAVRRGRAAMFEECGLGKTIQQLVWSEEVVKHTGKPVILHCPLSVRKQTLSEAKKFKIGVPVAVTDDKSQVIEGINIVNYEKLAHFDTSIFAGVVLDESSVLKAFTGKTKRMLCEAYTNTPYRLACTATPSPNDQMELGNQAEFLGIMPSNEMLSRWFINDTMKAGGYRLRGHAAGDFWSWVASWAVCVSKPSDIGGDDAGYNLPQLTVHRHRVTIDPTSSPAPEGYLINTAGISATNIHEEKRLTNHARADQVAEIVKDQTGPVVVWCHTDYESDALAKAIPQAVELRGSNKPEVKTAKLDGFANGDFKILITKPSLSGHGMNWQHCSETVFAGLNYSFEEYYQAVRRFYRFGQTNPVNVHIVLTDSDSGIQSAIARKETDHQLMQCGMAEAMKSAMLEELGIERQRTDYVAEKQIKLPSFLQSRGELYVSN